MAVNATFEADFRQFNAAVDGAVAQLRNFKVVVDNTGNTSLPATEKAAVRSGNAFGTLATGLSAADKTLGAFGVHIGPEIQALNEMSDVAGKTAGQLGLIGTASAVAGAALAGIGIGRAIANWFELDTKIANAAASLLGYGDVAAETAGAKQDVINRAIQNGAAATVTYTEAVQFNIEAAKKSGEAHAAHAKQVDAEKKAADDAAEALHKLQKAHEDAIHAGADKLFGNDAITAATDYLEQVGRIENVTNLNTAALDDLFEALTKGISAMVEQGLAADDLTGQMEQYRIAVVQAQQTHTQATTQMETDEQRLARESAELAQAMKDNFVIIGQSAQEAAQKASLSWNEAIDAARKGQGTLGGSFQSVAPGTEGSSVRYDDYGNPYGYIPGVNQPGKVSPTGGGGATISVFAQGSFFDTPESVNRLADKVGNAVLSRAAGRGGAL